MVTLRVRRLPHVHAWLVAFAVTLCTVLGPGASAPAAAAPGDAGEGEGSIAQLRAKLDTASREYLDAKAALEHSQQRQAELTGSLTAVEAQLAELSTVVSDIAVAAYRSGGLTTISTLIDSGSPNGFLDRVMALSGATVHNDRLLRDLTAMRQQLSAGRTAVDQEVASQQQHLTAMATAKQTAERELKAAGQGQQTAGPGGASSASATPSPRRANGSWPRERCSVNDPTTSGCITPRTLHALRQAQAAGFTRTASCYRSGGSGEHPKGRACDFASAQGSFGGVATGQDRVYGNNLAAFYVRNAKGLAVLYVIWFKQVWLPSSGWRSYSGGHGDPSSDHTNHVHVSIA
ncbi:MAG: hypothetical protein HKP61_12945 [Dactylosporangium sp.]|nr:hypothetical protein [Dactylosporangium sp.]NNJ61823.1 hypothetical protein [Dactylosporangium sp.]